MMKFATGRRAFTLIELLVVIAIIAILAAILFPVFAQAKQAAKTASTLSGVKQLALGHVMYNGDNDDTSFCPWARYPEQIYTAQLIYPYTKNLNIMWDTASPMPNLKNIKDPTGPGAWGQYMTVSWNMWAMYNGYTGQVRNMSSQEDPASRMIILPFSNPQGGPFSDPSDPQSSDIGWYTFEGILQSCADTADKDYVNGPGGGVTRAADKWHANGYLSGFLDGHAKMKKGMSLKTTDCWDKTGQFWSANFASGAPDIAALKGPNDWAAHYIKPEVLAYWGTWWDSSR